VAYRVRVALTPASPTLATMTLAWVRDMKLTHPHITLVDSLLSGRAGVHPAPAHLEQQQRHRGKRLNTAERSYAPHPPTPG